MNKQKILDESEWQNFIELMLSDAADKIKEKALETIDVNAKYSSTGETCLIEACKKNNVKAVTFLLAHGADPDLGDKKNIRPLFFAAHQNLAIVEILVKHNAEINFTPLAESGNYSPLCGAIFCEQYDIIQFLLKHGADPNLKGKKSRLTALHYAAGIGSAPVAKLLLENGANHKLTTAKLETPLHKAAVTGNIPLVKVLLEHGADPNQQDIQKMSPLYRFMRVNQGNFNENVKDMFSLFIQYKVNLNQLNEEGYTLLSQGVSYENTHLVALLLENKVKINQLIALNEGHTGNILHIIAELQPTDAIKRIALMLLKRDGIKLDQQDSLYGYTPLHIACEENNSWFVKTLLDHNANPNAQTSLKMTPLIMACRGKHLAIVKVLLTKKQQLKVNLANECGETALHHAALKGCIDIVKLLVQNGAKVNAQTKNGSTPLFIACQEGYAEVVKYLVQRGADPDIFRNDGNSCIYSAYKYGNRATLKILLELYYKNHFETDKDKAFADFEIISSFLLSSDTEAITFNFIEQPNYTELHEEQQCLEQMLIQPAPANTQNSHRLFATNDSLPSYPIQDTRAQTGFGFLMERGFSREDIKNMQQQNKLAQATHSTENQPKLKPSVVVTWFNGMLTMDMDDVRPIGDSQDNKSPNCFLYLDKQNLVEQGCNLELFEKLRLKFCAPQGEQGIKRLEGDLIVNVQVTNQQQQYPLTDEIKLKSSTDRILCFRQLSDHGTATLLVGAGSSGQRNKRPKFIKR